MTEENGNRNLHGGIVHTYLGYDPKRFPMPAAEAPDMVTPAFEHMLEYGSMRNLTPEELAEAIELDPSQIVGMGPSISSLLAMLEERKRKILETYETKTVREEALREFVESADEISPPKQFEKSFARAIRSEQVADLERLWYQADASRLRAARPKAPRDDVQAEREFAAQLVTLMDVLGDKYQVEELAAKYVFTGRRELTVEQAIEVKDELETIDRLIEQLKEAAKNAKIYVINMEELARFADEEQMEGLERLRQQVEDLMRHMAEQQGLQQKDGRYQLTPKAFKLFQSKLLDRIFSDLQAAKTGRHQLPVTGDGVVETQRTKPYEFGDSLANMDVGQSLINAMIRERTKFETSKSQKVAKSKSRNVETAECRNVEILKPSECHPTDSSGSSPESEAPHPKTAAGRVRLLPEDIEIHVTRNTPKCATAVCMDMSGSMRWGGQYVNVKRMALALHGLIRSEYPSDYVDFVEIFTLAKRRHISEVLQLLPRPVTIHDSYVRLKADLSDERLSERDLPPHFTNLQHGLRLARQLLQVQDTPNRQIILITDGLPTAHFEDNWLYLLYPPDERTEHFTLREGLLCHEQGITINIFLLSSWSQSEEDVRFAYRLAESTQGRVFFVGGRELDRYVVWDYVKRRRFIIG